ncbi:ATP-dependent DNA helicase [Halioxenophilus sp. WMMB6]|uniref:ATP-dependent DNA helicase n=1 Tax=Halioxenophilus sp. WMMB6 TaxID=3073815 RepID=UPI00295E6AF0|nr:ATP-dependent DNA helicase [Halioxenophilus sp. WMMB6]
MSGRLDHYSVSVGELVAFAAASGDLRPATVAGPTAQQGMAGHKRLRQLRPPPWQAERTLRGQLLIEGITLELAGRADFVRQDESGQWRVEELKTCLGDPHRQPPGTLHWAQAKVYGYLLGQELALADTSAITIQVTRMDLLTGALACQSEVLSLADLGRYTELLVASYCRWLQRVAERHLAVVVSSQALDFPFANYRPQQLAAARHVYRCVRESTHLLVTAPTGSGKTMTVLFPAAKSLGNSLVKQVVALSAKGSGQQVLLSALAVLRGVGLAPSLVQLTAKAKLCPCRVASAPPDEEENCPRCIGFYDRLPAARDEALAVGWLDSPTISAIAERHQICPFELALQMLPWMAWVVCDLNYWYDPMVRLSLFDQDNNQRLLLVDEVHNLPERGRAMLSAEVSTQQLTQVEMALAGATGVKACLRSLRQCQQALRALAPAKLEGDYPLPQKPPERLLEKLTALLAAVEQWRATEPAAGGLLVPGVDLGLALQPLRRFLLVAELYGDSHFSQVTVTGGAVVCLLWSADAGSYLAARAAEVRALVGFSATLSPLPYYLDNLGWAGLDEQQLHHLPLASAFPERNRLTLIAPFVDTRWRARAASLPALVALIAKVCRAGGGNYLLFMPSFAYLASVAEPLAEALPEWRLLQQTADSDPAQKEALLAALTTAEGKTLVLAVLGGVLAEAVDLPGGVLQGVIVVGTGMGQPDLAAKTLQAYWQQRQRDGYSYSFRIPGLAKVLQAGGRVIRSETDRAAVVLIDPRYTTPAYQGSLPGHWQPQVVADEQALALALNRFWWAD